MKFTPKPYQQQIIDHVKNHRNSAVFAGCGLGKTASILQAVTELIAAGKIRAVLVIAPLRVANLTWSNEIDKWGFPLTFANLRTARGRKAWLNQSAQVYVINFESIKSLCEDLLGDVDLSEMVLVLDELSKAKSPVGKRMKMLAKYAPKFKGRCGLTGTPMPNGERDLFGQYKILDGGARLGGDYYKFTERFFNTDKRRWNFWLKKGAKQGIQNLVAGMTITLRSEDHLNIPDVYTEDMIVAMPAKTLKQYKELQEELIVQMESGTTVETPNVMTLSGKLQQFTGGMIYVENKETGEKSEEFIHDAKVKALKKLIERERGEPLLVATQFKHERRMILEAIPEAQEWRDDILPDWNAGRVPVLIADPRSIGHGLNLQDGGCRAVWYSLTYSSELYEQFNARLARTGQENITRIIRLVCPGTIDDAIAEAIRTKNENQKSFLQSLAANLRRVA